MLLFLFLLCNSFVAAIDCCSLLLFVSRFVVRYQLIIIWWLPTCFRNSQLEMFYKKAVLQNLTIFTGKQLYWSLFLINCRSEDCNLIKKRLKNRYFLINFLKPSFLNIIYERLLTFLRKVVFIGMISCGIDRWSYHKKWKYKLIIFRVACVINLKFAFKDWFFYNLIILVKLCKMRYLNLVTVLLFSRNQVICQKNRKLWRDPNTIEFNILFLTFSTQFLLNNGYKNVLEIFFILFRSWVINKNIKNQCVETRTF